MNHHTIATASGALFPFAAPTAETINFRDMAEGLAKEPRWSGQLPDCDYKVAQHCVLVGDLLPPPWRIYGWLHDGHEGLGLKDLATPVKTYIRGHTDIYDRLAWNIDQAVHAAAGLGWPLPQEIAVAVHRADRIILATEIRDLYPHHATWAGDYPPPANEKITVWPWRRAYETLLERLASHLPVGGL